MIRRYDGSTRHSPWCRDHRHDGYCLDQLLAKIDERETEERADGE